MQKTWIGDEFEFISWTGETELLTLAVPHQPRQWRSTLYGSYKIIGTVPWQSVVHIAHTHPGQLRLFMRQIKSQVMHGPHNTGNSDWKYLTIGIQQLLVTMCLFSHVRWPWLSLQVKQTIRTHISRPRFCNFTYFQTLGIFFLYSHLYKCSLSLNFFFFLYSGLRCRGVLYRTFTYRE